MDNSPGFSAGYWAVRTVSTSREEKLAADRRQTPLFKLPAAVKFRDLLPGVGLLSIIPALLLFVLPDAGTTIGAPVLVSLLVCGAVVFNHLVVVPRYLDGHGINVYVVVLLPVPILVLAAVYKFQPDTFPLPFMAVLYSSAGYCVGTLCSLYHHHMLKTAKHKIDNLELSLLNARINPHFLFNSLNWIYALALEGAAEAPDAIVHLSQFMRYLIREADSPAVALQQELQYIKNYVQLQKGKLGNSVSLTFNIPAYSGPLNIAPLLLISFIENAFKYGVNPEEDSAIHLDLSVTHNRVSLHIINNKVSSMYSTTNTGIGVDNARRRLALLYPGRYQLDIIDDYKIYSVKLSLDLD